MMENKSAKQIAAETEEWLQSQRVYQPFKVNDESYEDQKQQDFINKPDHYHKGGFDIYEIMQAKMSPEEYRGFCKGNVLKYLLREDLKGGVEDIKKLRFNADRLIENMEGITYVPEYKKAQEAKE